MILCDAFFHTELNGAVNAGMWLPQQFLGFLCLRCHLRPRERSKFSKYLLNPLNSLHSSSCCISFFRMLSSPPVSFSSFLMQACLDIIEILPWRAAEIMKFVAWKGDCFWKPLQMNSLVAPLGFRPRWFPLTNQATWSWFILLMEPSSRPRYCWEHIPHRECRALPYCVSSSSLSISFRFDALILWTLCIGIFWSNC